MLSGGAAPGDVQKLLRHASYATTMNIYRHIMPGQLEKNFEIFNKSISLAVGGEGK
jgi:integrase